MIYLKKFENHAQYDNYINGSDAILPNVSICTTEGDVHYNPYVDPYAGHDYVEIGGIKWATMNIGATAVTDTGLYFQWGDTQGYTAAQVGSGSGQKYFGWEDYKYWSSDIGSGSSGMTKYNSTDGKTVLDLEDDAANVNWGGKWRMPTMDDFIALGAATTSAWTNNRLVVTDKTDSSKKLFFPAAGSCYNGSVTYNVLGKRMGYYYGSSIVESQKGTTIAFSDVHVNWRGGGYCYYGLPIRPVAD